MVNDSILNERQCAVLKSLIACYLQDGQPVASSTLAKFSDLQLSSASLRNVMANLEDLGFLISPHTSAGRIPTAHGYRFFVDQFGPVAGLGHRETNDLANSLGGLNTTQEKIDAAAAKLSQVTRLVGLVSIPKRDEFAFRQIEFVRTSARELLVILVFQDNEVQNRVVRTEREFSAHELEFAANYLNQNFGGQRLVDIRCQLVEDLDRHRQHLDGAMSSVINVAREAMDSARPADLAVVGQSNLMGYGDLSNLETLRSLFKAFDEKQGILHLLEKCVHAEGVQLFIGEESEQEILQPCSIVTAPYAVAGQVVGMVAVIGPQRIPYDRIIAVVDTTARVLGATLNQSH